MVLRMTSRFPSSSSPLEQRFAEAVDLHRAGRLAEAERGYRAILTVRSEHDGSLYLLGDIFCRQGRMAEASAVFRALVLLRPDGADGWSNLGLALRELGRGEP